MRITTKLLLPLLMLSLCTLSANVAANVIEVITFYLQEDVNFDEFRPLDKAVETDHVAKQPGFLARETAIAEDGQWLTIVYWESLEDAEASAQSFMEAAAAEPFLEHIDTDTMTSQYYSK
ncbi:antibiotic biosynthesis monooxygenase family protein [Vibrio sp. WXL103]|uniref:antibiotic biosynthesis monooxygenase family protein n=1 Tax=unclassified Vibrio TaxID=2614977 RepID=UPI003EC88074